jgi:uncharacterized protein DUF6962
MTLLEPDVALTDFALALECAGFAVWLHRRGPADAFLRRWFVVFFAALGLAALLGGIAHGFPSDPQSRLYWLVWTAILLAIGVTALAGWALGARLVLSEATATHVVAAAGAAFVGYASVVLFVSHSFAIAVIHYLPAAVFLLGAFVLAYLRQRNGFLLAGIAGLVLTFVAAAVQQSETSLHPVYFNHNALFHVIQAFALLLIFLAARGLHGPIAR